MNSKKVNWFFLTTILLHILIVVSVVVFRYVFTLGMVANFVVSSAIILVPALLFALASGENLAELLGFHKIKWSSAAMIVLFTFLTMPLTTLINTFSMLFVENAVMEISDSVLALPFGVSFFFMAVMAPVGEEIVFRGVVYRGYRRSGSIFQAMLFSALLFALGHMNFNQAAYAFVIGMILVLLVEATGSLWASVIYHVVFNGYSVCIMYLSESLFPELLEESALTGQEYTESMLYSMGISLIMAAGASAIAVCVLIWIARNEGRGQRLLQVWIRRREQKGKMVTIPLIIAMVLCIAFMVVDVILYKIM